MCNNSNEESLTQIGTFVGFIRRNISSVESFSLPLIVFKILAENCQKNKVIFRLSKTITLTMSRLTALTNGDFCMTYHKNYFINRKCLPLSYNFQDIEIIFRISRATTLTRSRPTIWPTENFCTAALQAEEGESCLYSSISFCSVWDM